jgi:hypothetical protein
MFFIHWRLLMAPRSHQLPRQRAALSRAYRLRWIIEEFFHALKTAGFDVEGLTNRT